MEDLVMRDHSKDALRLVMQDGGANAPLGLQPPVHDLSCIGRGCNAQGGDVKRRGGE